MEEHNDRLRKEKAHARARLQAAISGISPGERERRSRRVCNSVVALPEWENASATLLFQSMPGEVDTSPLVAAARNAAMSIYLPRVTGDEMFFHLWAGEELVRHTYGMLEPHAGAPEYLGGPATIVICPGLAFDRSGRRLGRGKGYYDRFLASLDRTKVAVTGICFEQQLLETVPADERDAPMDLVVTEVGVYRVGDA